MFINKHIRFLINLFIITALNTPLYGTQTKLVIDSYENMAKLVQKELSKGAKSIRIMTAHYADEGLTAQLIKAAKQGVKVTIIADPTLTRKTWKAAIESTSENIAFTFAKALNVPSDRKHLVQQAYEKQKLDEKGFTFDASAINNFAVRKIMHPKITLICSDQDNSFTLIMGSMNYQNACGSEGVFVITGTQDEPVYEHFSSVIDNYQNGTWDPGKLHTGETGVIDHANKSETTYFLPNKSFFDGTNMGKGELIRLIKKAKKRILINPQELDDLTIIKLLEEKKKSGVEVIIRLNKHQTYNKYNNAILSPSGKPVGIEYTYGDLASCIKPSTSNIRAMVIDDDVATLGSSKFWFFELRYFTQQVTVTHNKEFVDALAEYIITDNLPKSHSEKKLYKAISSPKSATQPVQEKEEPAALENNNTESKEHSSPETISLPGYTPAMITLALSLAARIVARKRFIKKKRHRRWTRRVAYAGMIASLARLGYVARVRSMS